MRWVLPPYIAALTRVSCPLVCKGKSDARLVTESQENPPSLVASFPNEVSLVILSSKLLLRQSSTNYAPISCQHLTLHTLCIKNLQVTKYRTMGESLRTAGAVMRTTLV
jgi:hypothetical protein